jgi:hypothetical protein
VRRAHHDEWNRLPFLIQVHLICPTLISFLHLKLGCDVHLAMPLPIPVTKLYIPHSRHNLVLRPHLVEQLKERAVAVLGAIALLFFKGKK